MARNNKQQKHGEEMTFTNFVWLAYAIFLHCEKWDQSAIVLRNWGISQNEVFQLNIRNSVFYCFSL